MTETMFDSADPWGEIASAVPDEQTPFEDLPDGAWFLGKTATEENGKAAPSVRTGERKSDGQVYYKFNVGLLAVGGDNKLNAATHANRICYFDAFVHPGEKESGVIGGRFTGFLNACFAAGVAEGEKDAKKRSAARWAVTAAKLKAVAATDPEIDGEPVTLVGYGGDKARYIAGLACVALLTEPVRVLAKTRARTYEVDGEKRRQVDVGSIEDATSAGCDKRKVRPFEAAAGGAW